MLRLPSGAPYTPYYVPRFYIRIIFTVVTDIHDIKIISDLKVSSAICLSLKRLSWHMHIGKDPKEYVLYIQATVKFTVFLRHSTQSAFYFPQNAIYLIILSLFSNNTFFIIHVLKFKYPPQWDNGSVSIWLFALCVVHDSTGTLLVWVHACKLSVMEEVLVCWDANLCAVVCHLQLYLHVHSLGQVFSLLIICEKWVIHATEIV